MTQLNRRRFLGMLAATAGAVTIGACSKDDGDDDAGPGGSTAPGADPTTTLAPAPPLAADPFALGVASGDPSPTSVILWTRLIADDLDGPRPVTWEVATDDAFADVIGRGEAPALPELGHSVHVDATGLEPDTWYWYRFVDGDFTSAVGRARTTPADDAAPDELRFAFASCQLRTAGRWTAYDHIVADDLDLVLHLGDYIYEYPGGTGELEVPGDGEPQTVEEYRAVYAAYKRDPKLQAAHAMCPWVVTWDDHEVENNYAADIAEDPADQDGFAARKAAAYQAFYEHHPVRIDPPADGALELHRDIRYGALAHFFVLDGRQHRTDQVCGDNIATNVTECPEIADPDATMLGTDQEAWLLDGLRGTEATWKVLAQQTVMKALVLGDVVLNVDQWDGYPAARARLLEAIRDDDVANVVVLTGDIHAGGAADLRAPDAGAEGPIVAHELVGPGISSPGLGAIGASVDVSSLGLAYANFEDNGYVRCTVTPERWTAEFVIVETIQADTSPSSVAATVTIDAGTAGLTRA